LNGTTWKPTTLPTPGSGYEEARAGRVSCASSTFCVAAGGARTTNIFGNPQNQWWPYVVTWNGTSWSVTMIQRPATATDAFLNAISCPTSGFCLAGGYWDRVYTYPENDEFSQTFGVAYSGGTWSEQAIPRPAGAVVAEVSGITCLTAENCKVVGHGNTNAFEENTGKKLVLSDEWMKPKP
jgi:hypothetical protein